MATELSNQVIARDVSDGQIVEGLAVASSIRQTYRTADLTALQAITGPVTGDFGYTIDNGYTYQWTGTMWTPVLYDTGWVVLSSVGVYATNWSGNAEDNLAAVSVRLRNGIVYMQGIFRSTAAWGQNALIFTFTDPRFLAARRADATARVVNANTLSGVDIRPDGQIRVGVSNGSAGAILLTGASWPIN